MFVNGQSKVTPFSRPADSNGLQAELSAIQVIAVALAQLEDEETRARVLHWATERFCRTVPVVPVVALSAPSAVADAPQLPSNPTPTPDDGLSVSALGELFGAHSQPVNGMLREFVAEFQGIVH